jgi:hypothetical protein
LAGSLILVRGAREFEWVVYADILEDVAMIDPTVFDETLRQLLRRETFAPFRVELEGGQRILICQPVLAFGGGSASFIDPEDGALVGFNHQQVTGFSGAGQEVGA